MVLIIDDEAEIQGLLLEVLMAEGIEAKAVGPHEALDALRELEPDVVLLDVSMPGLDGYEVLRHLRSDPHLSESFVLMLTGRTRLEDLEAGFESGADDYVTKPFAIDELVARVRRGLRAVIGTGNPSSQPACPGKPAE